MYYPIDENSSAFAILRVLLENKDRIIADRGLIEENGKTYYDHISVDRISFYEPYSFSVPDYEYCDNYEEF